jgi:hypothetical protein
VTRGSCVSVPQFLRRQDFGEEHDRLTDEKFRKMRQGEKMTKLIRATGLLTVADADYDDGPNGPLTEDAYLRYIGELHMLEGLRFELDERGRDVDALTERKFPTE